MELEEFKRVTRYMEPEYYESANLKETFDQYAEFDEQNEKSISLEGFNKLAIEKSLFKQAALDRFLNKESGTGFVKTLEDLRSLWFNGLEHRIADLLKQSAGLTPEMKILISKLGKLIKCFEPKIKDKLWVNYNILEGEVFRLYSENVLFPNYLASELRVFDDLSKK